MKNPTTHALGLLYSSALFPNHFSVLVIYIRKQSPVKWGGYAKHSTNLKNNFYYYLRRHSEDIETLFCENGRRNMNTNLLTLFTDFFFPSTVVSENFNVCIPSKGIVQEKTGICCCFSVVSDSFVTPWTAAPQASLSFTIFWSLLKLMSSEWMIPFNHLILCCPPSPPALDFPQHQSLF